MGDPLVAVRRVREALALDGTWLLVEPFASDEKNFTPVGRLCYSASTFLCVPNALSQGGRRAGRAGRRGRDPRAGGRGGLHRFRRAAQIWFAVAYEVRS